MRNRVQRQLEIRKIIARGGISSQDELLTELKEKGFDLTQATLSRDLKHLQVAKVSHPVKGYIYVIPGDEIENVSPEQQRIGFLSDGFKDLNFSGNLAVLRTQPGYASSFAAVIDSAKPWEILGTIAGDDTVLIIQKEGISKMDLINALITIMPNLKGKL